MTKIWVATIVGLVEHQLNKTNNSMGGLVDVLSINLIFIRDM